MRKLLFTFALLLCALAGSRAHAATCPISSGASSSTIVSTIQGCASGNTVTVAAGTYSVSSGISVPCGVTITGPTVPLVLVGSSADGYGRYEYQPTAILNFSVSGSTAAFSYGASCSTARAITYLEVNTQHPSSDGGQVIYVSNGGGVSNLTIGPGNYFHGNQGNTAGGGVNDTLIYFDGTYTTATDVNDIVTWNRLGASGDCSNLMSNVTYAGFGGNGGLCAGVAYHTNMSGFVVDNNFFYYQEEGLKGYGGGSPAQGNCLNCLFEYNDFSNIHRCFIETQTTTAGAGGPLSSTSITYGYNSFHDPFFPGQGTFAISSANGCDNTNPSGNKCTTTDIGNVIIDNVPAVGGTGAAYVGLGIEFWSSNTASAVNYNLIQGQWSNSIMVAQDGAASGSYNHIQSSYGAGGSNTPADCHFGYAGAYGWFGIEDSPANTPSPGTGNTCDFFDGSVQTSVTPSISPASGTFSGSQTVTLTNNGTNRDSNTSLWYTTDGSTPVPGTGTAALYTGPFTVTSTKTVKAVGMWGAANQPTKYPTGPISGTFGYQPSTAVSATYTSSGGSPTVATPVLSPGTESFSGSVSVSISDSTSGSTIYYTTNGTTPTTSSSVYSSPITVTAAMTIQAIAAASGYANSAVASATYTLSGGGTPTLSGVTLTLTGGGTSVALGGTAQACVNMSYTSPTENTTECSGATDAYGNTAGTSWASSVPADATISSSGLVTGVAAGSTTLSATVGSFNPTLAITVTSTPPTFASVAVSLSGGGMSLNTGSTVNALATCSYISPTLTTNCTTTDAYGVAVSTFLSSVPGNATITTPAGLITGVAAGSTNLTASVTGANVVTGVTTENNIANSPQNTYYGQYFIVGSNGLSPQTASIYIGSGTSGDLIDVGITVATSPTTQASSALCHGTITESGLTNQFLTVSLSGCGYLAPGATGWIWMNTNDPALNIGKNTCGSGCTGSSTSSTYGDCFVAQTYGTYTGLPTSFTTCPGTVQRSQYFTSYPVSPAFSLTIAAPSTPSTPIFSNMVMGPITIN